MWITADEEEDGDVAADGLSADGLMTKDDVLFDPAVTSLIVFLGVAMCLCERVSMWIARTRSLRLKLLYLFIFVIVMLGRSIAERGAGPINLCFQRNLNAPSVCIQIDTSRGLEQRIALAPPAFRHPSNHYWSVSWDQRYSTRCPVFFYVCLHLYTWLK